MDPSKKGNLLSTQCLRFGVLIFLNHNLDMYVDIKYIQTTLRGKRKRTKKYSIKMSLLFRK